MFLFFNLINTFLLLYIVSYSVKKRVDTCLSYYSIITLYFIMVPLLFDSIMILISGIQPWESVIQEANVLWSYGSLKNISRVSLDFLIFNSCFFLSYWVICKKPLKHSVLSYRPLNSSSLSSLTWGRCFVITFIGLAVFMLYNGIDTFYKMDVAEWYEHRSDSRLLGLIASLTVPIMSVGVLRMMFSKDFVRGSILLLPVLIIGVFTGARSQIIPVVFYFLYFFFWSNKKIQIKNVLLILAFGVFAIFVLTVSREEVNAMYPLYKDSSYIDLFYVYDVGQSITTHGLNSLAMIVRDFLPVDVEDITNLVADTKFKVGWGNLHPSLLGWAYVDLLEFNWLLAIFFGVFLAIYDRLRHKMPNLIYFLFLSYEFAFLAIAIRGSVRFAYSQLLYPTLILVALFTLDRLKIINCHYNSESLSKRSATRVTN